jgi:hypothetical protein
MRELRGEHGLRTAILVWLQVLLFLPMVPYLVLRGAHAHPFEAVLALLLIYLSALALRSVACRAADGVWRGIVIAVASAWIALGKWIALGVLGATWNLDPARMGGELLFIGLVPLGLLINPFLTLLWLWMILSPWPPKEPPPVDPAPFD